MRNRLNFALAAAVAAVTPGCSFLSVYGPAPTPKAVVDVSCTEERYAPALDVGAAASAMVNAGLADISGGERAGLVLGAMVWGGSALYGYLTTADCRRIKDQAHRYQTKLMLRQIDLMNESVSQHEPGETPPVPPAAPAAPPPPATDGDVPPIQ